MAETDKPDIETLDSREVYRNRWMRVREDRIRRRDGSEGIYGVIEKKDFAVIAAIGDGEMHLVQQYRYTISKRMWEMPQGALHDGEAPAEDVARTELREETGLSAERMEHIGQLHAAYGMCDNAFDVFLATGLTPGAPNREAEEQDMISRAFPIAEVIAMIQRGEIKDGPTVSAICLLQLHGKI